MFEANVDRADPKDERGEARVGSFIEGDVSYKLLELIGRNFVTCSRDNGLSWIDTVSLLARPLPIVTHACEMSLRLLAQTIRL